MELLWQGPNIRQNKKSITINITRKIGASQDHHLFLQLITSKKSVLLLIESAYIVFIRTFSNLLFKKWISSSDYFGFYFVFSIFPHYHSLYSTIGKMDTWRGNVSKEIGNGVKWKMEGYETRKVGNGELVGTSCTYK